MKIEGSGIVKAGSMRRSGRTSSSTASDFSQHIPTDAEPGASAVGGGAQLRSIEGLLALQEAPGALDDDLRGPGVQRGADLLAALEDIRDGLLLGRISTASLRSLVARLQERRQSDTPPRLLAILDEIELRARVELAKLAAI